MISEVSWIAQLIVRNLEDDATARLGARARRHRRSLEAEVRDILHAAAKAEDAPAVGRGTAIANRLRGHGFKPGEIEELRESTIEPAKFDK